MLVYTGTISKFIKDCDTGTIDSLVAQALQEHLGRAVSPAERSSWQNSLNQMAGLFTFSRENTIPSDAGVAIEYQVPLTSKRVDFMISGFTKAEKPTVVIIELKQWQAIEAVPDSSRIVKTFLGGGERCTVHPSYQAWTYAAFIENYNESIEERNICLCPCAYLHNYDKQPSDPLLAPQYSTYVNKAPVFTKQERPELRAFIQKNICHGDGREVLYSIENGRLRPSKKLQDQLAVMLAGNQTYIMLDDQAVAFDEIRSTALKCQNDHEKRTIIVKGGPGTGKSVIAVNLLVHLTRSEQLVQYISPNSAPRDVYRVKLRGKREHAVSDALFAGSASYADKPANCVDTLLIDESHRLVKRAQYTKDNGHRNQIRELIRAARCSVFFLDESQRIHLKDIGSEQEIRRCAAEEESHISELSLTTQFRCNGSDGYLAWLDNTLQIRETANTNLSGIIYDFRVFDSPSELRTEIMHLNKLHENGARLVAGYCWDWPKATRNNPEVPDIQIGDDFAISWNLQGGKPYAIDESSINEAGCIHTVQGLEFDYVGVIIGDDMRYENGRVITDYKQRASTDQSMHGIKKLANEDPEKAERTADELIKNTYRTLMTRGMKGCYVYCTNHALSRYLRSCIYGE